MASLPSAASSFAPSSSAAAWASPAAAGGLVAGGIGLIVGLVVGGVTFVLVVGLLLGAVSERSRTGIWRKSRTGTWRRAGAAKLLSLPLRLAFGPQAEVKLEEWLADLAAIESRWERWVYLIDLLGDLPQQAGAAREATREEPR